MTDLQTVELELEDETQEVELTIGDDTERYLELVFENEIDVIDTPSPTPPPTTTSLIEIDENWKMTGTITEIPEYFMGGSSTSYPSLASKIKEIELNSVTSIGSHAFQYCSSLTSVKLPELTTAGEMAFLGSVNLKELCFPKLLSLPQYMFSGCNNVETLDFPILENIGSGAFYLCFLLKKLILRNEETPVVLSRNGSFTYCYHITGEVNEIFNPDGAKDGYIYVPDVLVDSYKTDQYWKFVASQIKPLSELPEE